MKRCILRTARRCRVMAALLGILAVVHAGHVAVGQDSAGIWFAIQVVDGETGRGVPLIQLRTTSNLRYVTDSHGVVAFCEPGLMDREVFFHVEGHGYEYPKDGFGYRGVRLITRPGTTATIEVKRVNVAERLYRVTGQGIYRDSVLTGRAVPLKEPVLNGQVAGQDSVYTCIHRGRLFWLWGDTNRPLYPLGHFGTAGAISDLPGHGGLDPSVGVDLEYYVDETGFSRPIAKMKEHGMVWLDGLMTVTDPEGAERMVAKFARMKDLGEAYERGLMVFNDATASFEPVVRSKLEVLPFENAGHALAVEVDGQRYYYFGVQFPLSVRMRVKAAWGDVIDPNRYEVLTALGTGGSGRERSHRWVRFADLMGGDVSRRASTIKALTKEKEEETHLYDIESGKRIMPHGGSACFNAYRRRWIMIVLQSGGDSSYLGEVWYAEGDTPVGPWAYARKIVTHKKYSFYNPMQHAYFDQDGGRTIYFEGTYSHTFSGSPEQATARYDYNQIMYRLRLDDARLVLPVPVYRVRGEREENHLLLRDGVEKAGAWERVEDVPFYAVEPGRTGKELVAVYAEGGSGGRLTTERPAGSAGPLFCALSAGKIEDNIRVVDLYEYQHGDSGRYLYSTERRLNRAGWKRAEKPLCQVWGAPSGPLLLDAEARPLEDATR